MPASYLLSSDNCHAPRGPSTAANAKLAEANTKLQDVQNKVAALNAQLAELESQYAVRACCAAGGWVGDRPAWQVLHPVNAQFNSRPGA